MPTALITGVTGQDGAYLSRLLLDKGYRVVGTSRRTSGTNTLRLEALGVLADPRFELVGFDLIDPTNAIHLVAKYAPDEVYNLAAQSFVGVSFEQPLATAQMTGLGALGLLEAIRVMKPDARFYQASSSEMFGKVQAVPQNEDTPFYPRSPYAVAKLFAHWTTVNYREAHGLFAASGILFNHESPQRGLDFVTRKITHAVARMALGNGALIELGNLDAKRDWGYAAEYVEGMWRMLQHDVADSFVLATGRTASVRDFATMSFAAIGVDLEWSGAEACEEARDRRNGAVVLKVNPRFYRPAEVDLLIGDAGKARRDLGWKAETTLEDLCEMMVRADRGLVETGRA